MPEPFSASALVSAKSRVQDGDGRRPAFKKGAFSLVELLSVIAIIGILAAILIPTVGKVIDRAKKSTAANNLRQIAIAYMTYSTESGRARTINAGSIYEWARILAQHADLNEPSIYIIPEDPEVEARSDQPLPRVIATPRAPGEKWQLTDEFDGFPLSFSVVNRLSTRAPSSTPLAWTRGLSSEGLWAPLETASPSPYGDRGGHIVFLDGHVGFFRSLNEDGQGQLIHFTRKTSTANYQEAISPGPASSIGRVQWNES